VKPPAVFLRRGAFVLAGFGLALAYYLSYAYSLPFDLYDEGYLLVIATAIAQGLRLYKDVELYSYMPGLFYLFSSIVGSPAETFAASRTLMAVMLATNVCLLYWVSAVGGHRATAVAVALVLCVVPGAWYKAYQPTLWLLLLGCAQRSYMTGRPEWLAALGASAALGVYFRVEVMFAGVAMILVVLALQRAYGRAPHKRLLYNCGITIFAFVITLLPLLALVAGDGILSEFMNQLLDLPRRFTSRVTASYRVSPPPLPGFELPSRANAHRWLYWGSFVIPVMLLVYTVSIAWRSRKRAALRPELGLAVIFLVWLAMNLPQYAWERPDSPHLAERLFALLAPVPLLVGWSVRLATAASRRRVKALAWAPSAMFLVYFSGYLAANIGGGVAGAFPMARPRVILANGLALGLAQPMQPVLDRVIVATAPDEPVAALPYLPGFHFLTARPFPAPQVYLFPFNTRHGVESSYICALERRGVRYVLYSQIFGLDGTARTALHSYAPRIHAHLMSHFAPEMTIGAWTLLRRTPPADAARNFQRMHFVRSAVARSFTAERR
jgi:hypothetical protein